MRFVRISRLEQFCLHIIVENLEKFIYNKNVPQKHIDFLLRVYAEEVFKRFSHMQSISEDIILWFLNPHTKRIAPRILSVNIIKQLQIVGPTITGLSLSQSLATERTINSILCCIPHVTHLDLSGSQCSDRTLLCVQKMCHAVINLNLYDCPHVTDEGMENLCSKNVALRNLNLVRTSVKQHGISVVLKGIPLLECLKYHDLTETLYRIHETDFEGDSSLSVRYNLTELIYEEVDLYLHPISVLLTWTLLCPKVTRVHLWFAATRRVLDVCARFPNLKELKISSIFPDMCNEGDSPYLMLAHVRSNVFTKSFLPLGSRLTALYLSYTEIPTALLIELHESLRDLCLQNVIFTEFEGDDIPLKENKLERLAFRNLSMNVPSTYKAILFLLSVSKNVNELHLTGINHMPQDVPDIVLKTMKQLAYVDFSYSTVYFPSFVRFFEIPSMKGLRLECLNISPLMEDSDFNRLVALSLTSTLSWCLWEDCSDESDDESYDNDSFNALH